MRNNACTMPSAVLDTPVGRVGITVQDGAVRAVDLLCEAGRYEPGSSASPVLRRTIDQLERYFDDPDVRFDLPIAPVGTRLQLEVWKALGEIPPGEVVSYGALAKKLDTVARAVGGACRCNPIPIIVPCHRVVAGSGIGGFMGQVAGPALSVKQWLLEHELRCRNRSRQMKLI